MLTAGCIIASLQAVTAYTHDLVESRISPRLKTDDVKSGLFASCHLDSSCFCSVLQILFLICCFRRWRSLPLEHFHSPNEMQWRICESPYSHIRNCGLQM